MSERERKERKDGIGFSMNKSVKMSFSLLLSLQHKRILKVFSRQAKVGTNEEKIKE